jgi:hypothetical protein
MSRPVRSALPPRTLPPSEVRPGAMRLLRAASPLYLRVLLGFDSLRILHPERLVGAYRDFFDLKSRLIVAFRHPYGDEPQLMAYVIAKQLNREAAKLGVRFPKKPHAHFIHGYEVPLWAGGFERWVLPRVGSIPIYHTKFDTPSMSRIRSVVKDGAYPLALAPEGQVSYTSEDLPRMEQGTIRIGLWCAEDLAKEKRTESVVIIPVSVHHKWPETAGRELDRLIALTERACGICGRAGTDRFARLSAIADRALAIMEQYYAKFHGPLAPVSGATASRADRLAAVVETALRTAERSLCIKPEGDAIRRVYRIRQTCWDRIFRADIPDMDALSSVERAVADRLAAEAWLASRHMELVDIAFYLDFERLKKEDPLELYIETAQNYYDLLSRLSGRNIAGRKKVGGKKAVVIIGKPVLVSRGANPLKTQSRAVIDSLTEKLAREYLECIKEIRGIRGASAQKQTRGGGA